MSYTNINMITKIAVCHCYFFLKSVSTMWGYKICRFSNDIMTFTFYFPLQNLTIFFFTKYHLWYVFEDQKVRT